MEGTWVELKIRLESDEYEKLKTLASQAETDLTSLVRKLLRRFIESSIETDSK